MIAVIREGEAMRDAFVALKDAIKAALAQEKSMATDQNHIACIESLHFLLATHPRPPGDAIAAESRHFKTWEKRNRKERERATQRRRYRGIPESTSPEGSRTKFAPMRPKSSKPLVSDTMTIDIDEEPEITAEDVFAPPPAPIPNPGFVPPTREELAAQLAADAQLTQDLLRDEAFRAITINPKGAEPKKV